MTTAMIMCRCGALVALVVLAVGCGGCGLADRARGRRWPADRPLPSIVILERTAEPLIKAEMPWEDFCFNGFRIHRIGDEWHMWYQSFDRAFKSDQDSYLCYARSSDGVTWERPKLGLVSRDGNTNNNILARNVAGANVWIDEQAPPAERFKLLVPRLGGLKCHLYGATSPDGFRWTWIEDEVLGYTSDNDCVCFRDGDIYRLYPRVWSEGPFRGKRQVGYSESKTFGDFAKPEVILAPDEQDPPDMHFYLSAAAKVMDGLYVMFPAAFYTDRQIIVPHFAVSRDGKDFRRVGREPIMDVGKGFDSRCIYVVSGLFPAGAPNEYWVYYLGSDVPHDETLPDKVSYCGGAGRFRIRLVAP